MPTGTDDPAGHGKLEVGRVCRGAGRKVEVHVAADRNDGELQVRFGGGSLGPFNMPLVIRATMRDERGYPLVAESPLAAALVR